ncbi:chorismate-binding protein [Flagellimonas marinaquae]|uniref:chorismate-binding protein n=1 Tax=Flagellimonas marinaquae TaxID=254955 RepID=UPI001F493330|nr:chorismate-binding protein [Allomuricauda aquimarina]
MHYLENKELDTIWSKVGESLEKGLPFALYRKPDAAQIYGVFQSSKDLNVTKDFTESGFVFAPFDKTDKAILVQPDAFWTAEYIPGKSQNTASFSLDESGKEAHLQLVKRGIAEIKKGRLQKVVLSRKMEVPISQSPLGIFKTLLNTYPSAFGYLFHHPEIDTWCGATPETLVKVQNRQLRTMSLAATLPHIETEEPQWGEKEIQEQQMVSEYIGDKLAHAMEVLEIDEAESVRAGNLWHLRSEVRGTMLPNIKVREVIKALHPTPAVCGIPTGEAQLFIASNENYERTYYTGFLGELNLAQDGETALFVNLRCMELKGDRAFIFVGGGITEASDPESEWVETQNKSKTMLGVL